MQYKRNQLINTSQKNIDKDDKYKWVQTTSQIQGSPIAKQGFLQTQLFPKTRKRINTVKLIFTEPCDNYYELPINKSQYPQSHSLFPFEWMAPLLTKNQNKKYFTRATLLNDNQKYLDFKSRYDKQNEMDALRQIELRMKALEPIESRGSSNDFLYQNHFHPKFQPKKKERKHIFIKKQSKPIELNGSKIKLLEISKETPTPQIYQGSPRQKFMKKQNTHIDNYKLTAWDTNTEDIQIYDDIMNDFFFRL